MLKDSDPADVAVVIYAADGAAEGPLEAGRSPPVGLRRFYADRDSSAVKSEVDGVVRVRNAITLPALVERVFVDQTAQLCDEALHATPSTR